MQINDIFIEGVNFDASEPHDISFHEVITVSDGCNYFMLSHQWGTAFLWDMSPCDDIGGPVYIFSFNCNNIDWEKIKRKAPDDDMAKKNLIPFIKELIEAYIEYDEKRFNASASDALNEF